MTQGSPQQALAAALERATAALAVDDTQAAHEAMNEGADLCRRLHEAGVPLPHEEAATIHQLADRCGLALLAAGKRLNDEGFREELHRRGRLSYQESSRESPPR